ncbi:MAG: hypothetical protein OXN96_19190 [Bryobacterales bacterium]|nr:hypothetical protein [Bryobacterales bacterium]
MPENLYGREFWVRDLDGSDLDELIEGYQPKDVASAWAAKHLSPREGARLEITSCQSGRRWTCNVRASTMTHVWGVEEKD